MDDKRAALLLGVLALAGAGVRWLVAPGSPAPGDIRLEAAPAQSGLQETARRAAALSRPLAPGERIDLDRADVTEITRLPRIGPALAQRIVTWRTERGAFGGFERLDSVPGIGPKLLEGLRPYVIFSSGLARDGLTLPPAR